MMFVRRVVAALLVVAPTVAAIGLLIRWAPLPDPVSSQWSRGEVTSTQPLWMLLVPWAALTILGLGLAIGAVADRDRTDPLRGTLYLAALLTATSAGSCLAILAMNIGLASSSGGVFFASLALGPIYALIPLAVVAIRPRAAAVSPAAEAESFSARSPA